MEKFAKIFETEHRQILVVTDINDDQDPVVRIETRHDGASVALNLTFKGEDDDAAWAAAERGFDKVTQEVAVSALREPLEMLDAEV